MASNVTTHSKLWELHASSMTVDLASSRMGRSWLKTEVEASNVTTHSKLWELHASSMTVDLASSRMGRSWLKIEVDGIKRYN
jgi:hypothetical protein